MGSSVEAEKDETLLQLRQLGLSFRARPVLRGIDWVWRRGQHWAVLGPNGAGKSSLAGVLAGEHEHFTGELRRGNALAEGGIAYVCFEAGRRLIERDRRLHDSDPDGRQADSGTRVRDLFPSDATAADVAATVDLLDLRPVLDRGQRFLSTGEMRKALLASAILSNPALLILDSPLDGLDRRTQQRFREALDRIIATAPAVLVLCRSAGEIPDACEHTLLLDRGRVRAAGETRSLRDAAVTRELLAPPPLRFAALARAPASAGVEETVPTLELRDVSASFGDLCVFRNLSWRLGPRQHCLIAGPNGSGKSTLLDLLTGDNHLAYGQNVSLFGRRRGSGESVWDIKQRFGRVDARMQFAVPAGNSVLDVVMSGHFDSVGLRDRPSDRQRASARSWLRNLGLSAMAADDFHTLSFGLQRLVLLARAMVKEPRILLLDEATLSLDDGHRRLLLEAVDHVIAGGSGQLLFVSHTAGEVPRCINQILQFEPHRDGSRVQVSDYSPGEQTLPIDA